MCKGVDATYREMVVRKQVVAVNALFNWIEEERLGLLPQLHSLLVKADDLTLGASRYFLAQPQVFEASDTKCNACVGIRNLVLNITCCQSFDTLYLQMIEQQVLCYRRQSLSLSGFTNALISQKHGQMNVFVRYNEIHVSVD